MARRGPPQPGKEAGAHKSDRENPRITALFAHKFAFANTVESADKFIRNLKNGI